MKVKLEQVNNLNFLATTQSGHQVMMDGGETDGGLDQGARPMEVVLSGLGGCSAIDVMLILKKSRQAVSHCEIEIDAVRADSIPRIFTKIHIHYIVTGVGLDSKKVGRAVDLSMEKYCSVTRMLEQTAEITADFEIANE
ncbi:MAG: OsmC family protein [Gammaproteobacteria bacterium]|nr:OsmC family protein [Gammaproteobacteria bacterium]